MAENLTAFFEAIKNGTYGYVEIFNYFKGLWESVLATDNVRGITDWINGTLGSVLPFILLGVYGLMWLFGKRLIGLIRAVVFFLAGYLLGVYYLAPVTAVHIPELPAYAVGLALGICLALIGRALYFVLYTVTVGYGVYLLFVSGLILPDWAGNMTLGAVFAAVAIVLAFLLRSQIERLGTAYLGALGILTVVIQMWFDFPSLVPGFENAILQGATAALAILGYLFQHTTRKKKTA